MAPVGQVTLCYIIRALRGIRYVLLWHVRVLFPSLLRYVVTFIRYSACRYHPPADLCGIRYALYVTLWDTLRAIRGLR